MHLAELKIENFRLFGEGVNAFTLNLSPGLSAIVGENDSGKSAVIDAIRMALGTRDQEFRRVNETDFHRNAHGVKATEIRIRCKFVKLDTTSLGGFVEYLSYQTSGEKTEAVLYVNWTATEGVRSSGRRRFTNVEVRSGESGDGPVLDGGVRAYLLSTYLRPLRDAERELSSGRGSRLSQILQHTEEVKTHGEPYVAEKGPPVDLKQLSVLGITDFADSLLESHPGVVNARDRLNSDYLNPLSFAGDTLKGVVSVGGLRGDTEIRLRQILEKLELELVRDGGSSLPRGLGSNNLLFVACELLLLGAEKEGHPILLIEEPEAHLHPQRQLRLMKFLQDKIDEKEEGFQDIQVIVTTHSPNLASSIHLKNLILMRDRRAYSMAAENTSLESSDYGFLSRFLDATKANLFFARGVLIVEGDGENLLLPTLARLLGKDLTLHGVSVVNVGGIGLRRFARIFQRKDQDEARISIPVACITDADVMPDCAPVIIRKVAEGKEWPTKSKRKWRAQKDFSKDELAEHLKRIDEKASGQHVKTFIADHWTLEYDLAASGLSVEVWIAVHLTRADEKLNSGKAKLKDELDDALKKWKEFKKANTVTEIMASQIYGLIVNNSKVSKATFAQYFAMVLEKRHKSGKLDSATLRAKLPPYLVSAIDYVTSPIPNEEEAGSGK